jgi:hypothetical protein
MLDVEKFIAGLHEYLGQELGPLAARVKAVEERAGVPGKDGEPGKGGEPGRDGKDGKSLTVEDIAPLLDGMIAKAMLDLERRAQDILQRAVDRLPPPKDGRDGMAGKDGKDGQDGVGFDDMFVEDDGQGNITLQYVRGDIVKGFRVRLPCIIDRGVYREETTYQKMDAVSYGGSLWLAQTDKPAGRPMDGSKDWRLAVKKGRDGRDGKDGERGPEGKQGPAGRDLTQMGPDGRKW